MTKVIRLGQTESPKQLKPIEFEKLLATEGKLIPPTTKPNYWQNIEIICERYNNNGDALMFAYNENRNNGHLYIGKVNDGIV